MTVSLTEEKKNELLEFIDKVLSANNNTIRTVSTVIGKIVASLPGSLYGPLYYRCLENDRNLALKQNKGNYDARMMLSIEGKNDLAWWQQNLLTMSAPIQWPPISREIATDASQIAWGASYGTQATGGAWAENELDLHINIKEMLAILYGLRSFLKHFEGSHVKVLCDNTTSVSVLNKMGSTHSPECNDMAKQIWLFCQQHNIFITCAHIPGKENTIPDQESRKIYKDAEWMLNKDTYQKCIGKLDFDPTIDCFASRVNTQHSTYASFKPDPFAKYINAFSLNWDSHRCYIFPPFSMIAKVLQKIRIDRCVAMVILPVWPTQAWWPQVREMLISYIVHLKHTKNLLVLPNKPGELHPMHQKLNLIACLLSGKAM